VFPALPAKAVFGPAQVFAEAAMLTALREVEERGLGDYRDAVRRLNGASLRWISENLIPAQMKHISDLEELLSRL
jgi:hypothetical protein